MWLTYLGFSILIILMGFRILWGKTRGGFKSPLFALPKSTT